MSEEKKDKQFFKMKEFVGVEDTGNKTPNGVAILKVLFEDGTSEVTTQVVFDLFKSSVEVTPTMQRDLITVPLVQRIFSLMTDYNVIQDDVNHIVDAIANTYNKTFEHAANYLFKTEHTGYIPMLRINEINNEAEAAKKSKQ